MHQPRSSEHHLTAVQCCRTALHLAARAGQAGAVRVLVAEMQDPERGVYVNQGDAQGITALFLALQKGLLQGSCIT